MRTVLLIRHAKSSWADPGVGDFNRPLNERGLRDAPEMAHRLRKRGPVPERLLSSSARRAEQTAKIFAKELKIKKEDIILQNDLYLADAGRILEIVQRLPDEISQIAVFAHNPGITDLANQVAQVRIDNIPTCGLFAVQFDIPEWADIDGATGEFLYFDYPKNKA